MPPDQYKFQMATQDFQSAQQTPRRKTGQAVKPAPLWVSCNLYVSDWLEKSTSLLNTGETPERKVRPQGLLTQNYPCS